VLGAVRAESVELTVAGEIVRDTWAVVERRFPAMALDAHVVMPDHIHAMVWLSLGAGLSLGRVVGTFKGLSARRVNAAWGGWGLPCGSGAITIT
jgi:putative transposase